MQLEPALDRLHARAVGDPRLRLFAAATRGLLAAGFLPPGIKKFGGRFTQIPISEPVGFFFEAIYQAHGFYLFVGAMQILAGVLLLFPATTTLGAVLYFPLILSIFVINLSVGFTGTYFVTGLMLLAALFLLLWDYDRWKSLLPRFGASAAPDPARHPGPGLTLLAGGAVGLAGFGAAVAGLALLEHRYSALPLPLGMLLVGIALCGAIAWRRLPPQGCSAAWRRVA